MGKVYELPAHDSSAREKVATWAHGEMTYSGSKPLCQKYMVILCAAYIDAPA